MTDNKLTDNEIKKAFECFVGIPPCVTEDGCKYRNYPENCKELLGKEVFDFISRQQAEIERLEKVQVNYAKAFIDEYAERLKSDITIAMSSGNVPFREIIDELTETMKNEYGSYTDFTDLIVEKTIKEFAERLNNEAYKNVGVDRDFLYYNVDDKFKTFDSVDDVIEFLSAIVIKEMVGETE